MLNKNTITCIILNYNNYIGLRRNLNKILTLDVKFDQIIVVNDGSTDNSLNYLNTLKKHKLQIINNIKNLGINKSFNKALKFVKSQYIFSMSTDDNYSHNIVKIFKKNLCKYNNKPKLIFGNAEGVYLENNFKISQNINLKNNKFFSKENFIEFYLKNPFTFFGGNILMETNVTRYFGGYHLQMRWHSDWLLYLLISLNHGCLYVNDTIVKRYIIKKSYSSNMKNIELEIQNIKYFLLIIRKKFKMFQIFRQLSVLPNYNYKILGVFLFNFENIRYFSSALIKKFIFYNLNNLFGIFFSKRVKSRVKKIFKV